MIGKPVVLLPLAEQDVDDTLEYYRHEGGVPLAVRWVQAVTAALRHVGLHPASGSPRYMDVLDLPGLRFWRVSHFPYLVFYVERATQVDVWRVVHAERDLAHWLRHQE